MNASASVERSGVRAERVVRHDGAGDEAGSLRIARNIYSEVRNAHDWGRQFPESLSDSALEKLAGLPPREMRRAVQSAFGNQGQICLCGSRVLVEESIYPKFAEKFVSAAKALVVGDPLDPATQQGSLISKTHLDKVRGYVDLATREGGKILCGEPCRGGSC